MHREREEGLEGDSPVRRMMMLARRAKDQSHWPGGSGKKTDACPGLSRGRAGARLSRPSAAWSWCAGVWSGRNDGRREGEASLECGEASGLGGRDDRKARAGWEAMRQVPWPVCRCAGGM